MLVGLSGRRAAGWPLWRKPVLRWRAFGGPSARRWRSWPSLCRPGWSGSQPPLPLGAASQPLRKAPGEIGDGHHVACAGMHAIFRGDYLLWSPASEAEALLLIGESSWVGPY